MSTQFVYDLSCFANIINGSEPVDDSRINLINYTTKSNHSYKILNYKKETLTKEPFDVGTYGLLRSVVINSNNQIVAFAPPKSYELSSFSNQFPTGEDLVVEEFAEGTMINLFYDNSLDCWQIATRRTVGGDVSFYHSKEHTTFSQMFLEACKENNFDINSIGLDTQFMYSFVLQHPKNRIVLPIKKPQLYLVAVYYINNTTLQVIPSDMKGVKSSGVFSGTSIKFPETYSFISYEHINNNITSNINTMGYIIRNKVYNIRTKIRNPVYEEIRLLKGNQPKLQYQYLILRHQGKVGDFLKYYPENKKEFAEYRNQVHEFTNTLFNAYVSCYIKKEAPLNQYSGQVKTHMFNIHKIFLTTLKEQGLYVTMSVVVSYVNGLHPSQLMYALNFDKHVNVNK